jgi:hypothetical protein
MREQRSVELRESLPTTRQSGKPDPPTLFHHALNRMPENETSAQSFFASFCSKKEDP